MEGKIFINSNYNHILERNHKREGVNKGNIRRTIRKANGIAWKRGIQEAIINFETYQIVIVERKEEGIKVITSYFSDKERIEYKIKKYNKYKNK